MGQAKPHPTKVLTSILFSQPSITMILDLSIQSHEVWLITII